MIGVILPFMIWREPTWDIRELRSSFVGDELIREVVFLTEVSFNLESKTLSYLSEIPIPHPLLEVYYIN